MNNSSLRTLLIFGICLPLALLIGYMLKDPASYASFGTVGIVLFVLVLPLLLRYHQPMLLAGWNASMIVFFLPGAPSVWLPLAFLSLLISIFQRTIDREFRFLSVPTIHVPLFAIGLVVFITAQATGGIKFRSMGGEGSGGKQYLTLLGAIIGYFALTARPIPQKKVRLYVALFLLSGITAIIGDVFYFQSNALQFIYAFFPPNIGSADSGTRIVRLGGVNVAASVAAYYMLARYGIRSIFTLEKPWRFVLFASCVAISLLGGFRSALISLILVFLLQFWLEGLHRTKLLPTLLLLGVLATTVTLPFLKRMPYSVQRALSFLPVPVDPVARMDAEATTEWRINLWKSVLPQVPKYLFLGKGYALTREDVIFAFDNFQGNIHAFSEDQSWAAIVGDYHNGPLSILIPFGIWGAIAFLWFLAAGLRVLYQNYRYGPANLRNINTFLLAMFSAKIVVFLLIFGSLFSDLYVFAGYLGIGVALNCGVCRKARYEPTANGATVSDFKRAGRRFRPAFQESGNRAD